LKPVFIIVITVVVIGVMVPSVFAETVSNYIGLFHLDESTYEIPASADSTNLVKVYGTVETIVKGDRGNILFTTPDGTTDGSSFLVTKDGNFESFFILNKNSQIGDYSVFVSYGPHPIGTLHFSVSEKVYSSQDISAARNEFDQVESEDQAAEARAAGWQRVAAAEQRAAEQRAAEQRAAEQRAAEQRAAEERTLQLALQKQAQQKAAEQRAAEQRAAAAEQRAAEQRAAEQRAAEARAEAAIRAAESKAAQDLTNFLIIIIAIASISLVIMLAKRKNKKSTTPQRSTTSTSPPNPPPSPSGNTETSTMFFYECPKCHSGDIVNNPDGSVNCPDCGYRV
jgi:hypothetical protein